MFLQSSQLDMVNKDKVNRFPLAATTGAEIRHSNFGFVTVTTAPSARRDSEKQELGACGLWTGCGL
jgi:hypothetical protein